MFIILCASIVESMSQLVSGHGTESTVFEIIGPFIVVKWRLQDTSRENDLTVWRRVVSIDSLGVHFPSVSISLSAESGPCSLFLEEDGIEDASEVVVGRDGDSSVPPLKRFWVGSVGCERVSDFGNDGLGFLLSGLVRGLVHPRNVGKLVVEGVDDRYTCQNCCR